MADLKITELPALTTVLGEDLLAIVDDPTGTASTKKIRTDDFQSTWHIGARVYNDANISIPNNSLTDLTFNSERYDTDTIHSTGTNTNRLTCQTAGKYLIVGNVRFAANGNADRRVAILLNNATYIAWAASEPNPTLETAFIVTTIYDLSVGNYVTLQAYQNTGGALNVEVVGNLSPEFMMHKIG